MEQTKTAEQKVALWNSNYTKAWVSNFMIFFSFMLLTPLLPLYMSEEFGADKDLIGRVFVQYIKPCHLFFGQPRKGYFAFTLHKHRTPCTDTEIHLCTIFMIVVVACHVKLPPVRKRISVHITGEPGRIQSKGSVL